MTVKEKLKAVLIEGLKLEDLPPEEIDDGAPLFVEGLGLDSLDAVELVVLLQKHFGVVVKDIDEGRVAFRSVDALASFIEQHLQYRTGLPPLKGDYPRPEIGAATKGFSRRPISELRCAWLIGGGLWRGPIKRKG